MKEPFFLETTIHRLIYTIQYKYQHKNETVIKKIITALLYFYFFVRLGTVKEVA